LAPSSISFLRDLTLTLKRVLKMKMHVASLTLLCLTLAVLPAVAGNVYDNGPVNGQVDAWTINFGFTVSDSFRVSTQSPIDQIEFYAWLIPGDTITSVEVQIGNQAFENNLTDVTVNLAQSNCSTNNFGYSVCMEIGNWRDIVLPVGNYWVTLGNAVVPSGDPVYWDENSGVGCQSPGCPSQAQENTIGTIPSEAFTIGNTNSSTSTTSTGTTPEPSSMVLFGSGILSLAGILRRRPF
jgi:hypothetical protein